MSFFPISNTHWSVVLRAGQGENPASAEALNRLCQTYWYPIYAFARSRGLSHPDAEDITQAFFAHFLEKNSVAKADPQKGRFRSFLLVCFKNFQITLYERGATAKRGFGKRLISLDEQSAEERYAYEPKTDLTPENIYERNWALSVMEQSFGQLKEEYHKAGKGSVFVRLNPFLTGRDSSTPYASLTRELKKSEAAIKMEVSRMRVRYREALLEVVGHTVEDPSQAEEELRYLLAVLSR